MARVKVHRNQLTLPEEARRKLNLEKDGELDVEVIEDGVLLRPARGAAYKRIQAIQKRVRYVGEEPRPGAPEEERQIAELVEADERKR